MSLSSRVWLGGSGGWTGHDLRGHAAADSSSDRHRLLSTLDRSSTSISSPQPAHQPLSPAVHLAHPQFPTIHALSLSTSERVHALWTGLGYYSRATRLLQAAQKVVADYDGILPSDPAVLQKEIPGVGPYTAGAIASIAYGVKAPVVSRLVRRGGSKWE